MCHEFPTLLYRYETNSSLGWKQLNICVYIKSCESILCIHIWSSQLGKCYLVIDVARLKEVHNLKWNVDRFYIDGWHLFYIQLFYSRRCLCTRVRNRLLRIFLSDFFYLIVFFFQIFTKEKKKFNRSKNSFSTYEYIKNKISNKIIRIKSNETLTKTLARVIGLPCL